MDQDERLKMASRILDFLELHLEKDDLGIHLHSERKYLKNKRHLLMYETPSNRSRYFSVESMDDFLPNFLKIHAFFIAGVFPRVYIWNPFFKKSFEEIQIMLDLAA